MPADKPFPGHRRIVLSRVLWAWCSGLFLSRTSAVLARMSKVRYQRIVARVMLLQLLKLLFKNRLNAVNKPFVTVFSKVEV